MAVSEGTPRPAGQVPAASSAPPLVVVRPTRGWAALDLAELWRYRELLFFLAWRDVKVRYKQTVLGAAWAILQPLATMLVFSLFFGRLARMPSDGVPYPLFSLAALVPWTLFSNGLAQSANSLVGSQNLVTKVYFPRLAIPVAAVLSGAVDAAFSVPFLLALMFHYGVTPTARILWLPLPMLLAFSAALGAGLWLSALNVRYRDVRYIVPFLLQLWLFATPIAYPSSLLSEPWRTVYGLNPMAGVVEGCRWALLGTGASPWRMLAASAGATLALLAGGVLTFRRLERTFADLI